MTAIDYLLLGGAVLAGGYVIARLLVGWLRSSPGNQEVEPDEELNGSIVPGRQFERVEKTVPPWQSRK